jgi:hypothetical protein
MAPVIAYTRGEYATDLLKGRSDPEATPRIVKRVTELTGLEEEFVRRAGGRLEIGAYLREVFPRGGQNRQRVRLERDLYDPFPFAPGAAQQRSAAGEHHRAHHHGDGGFCDARGGLEDRRALQRAQLRSGQPVGLRQPPCARARCPTCGRRWRPTRSCAC